MVLKAFWTVTDVASRYSPRHYAAALEHEKNYNMTYEATEEARWRRLALFIAVVWCTTAEFLLFSKYPEAVGHDTKAYVSEIPAPWWYSIGIREKKHTFVFMRGIIANETLAMIRFVWCLAFPFLYGKMLQALTVQLSDGKDEVIQVLAGTVMRDGITPNSRLLRCAWHIIDRVIWRIFGNMSRDWLYRFFQYTTPHPHIFWAESFCNMSH